VILVLDPVLVVSYAALWLLVAVNSLVLLGLVQAVYRLRQASPGPVATVDESGMIGRQVPPFDVVTIDGKYIHSEQFEGHKTVLLFVAPGCAKCREALDDRTLFTSRGDLIVICQGDKADCEQLSIRHALRVPVAMDSERKVGALLRVPTTPTAVLINRSGRITSFGYPHIDEAEPQELAAGASVGGS
jgi:peroxiredoxin